MPGKTITVFNYGYTSELTGVNSYIDYGIYAFFNSPSWSTGFGMPNSKFAPYTINLNPQRFFSEKREDASRRTVTVAKYLPW